MNLADFSANDNPALRAIIDEQIRRKGPISFADFFRLALYHSTYGYYVCCDPTDDYQSSPNVHPVFGAAIARQLTEFWRLMDRPSRFDVFEAAAGSGRLAADVLRALQIEAPDLHDALRYFVQDVTYTDSATAARLERTGLPMAKIEVATELPEAENINGCLLSNELLDAIPFERIVLRDGAIKRLLVGLDSGRLVEVEADSTPEIDAYFGSLELKPGEGCKAEVGLEALSWTRRAAVALHKGYILTMDYGYEAEALYAPWRKQGTLLSFYRHTSGDDPYVRIGRQDLTASVDFTSVRRSGEIEGLTTLGLTTQTDFLTALGVSDALHEAPAPGQLEAFYALRRGVMELIDASGLGRIRVLVQGRDVLNELPKGLQRRQP